MGRERERWGEPSQPTFAWERERELEKEKKDNSDEFKGVALK